MTRDEAYKLVTSWTKNKNLVKHMVAVEAEMRALAKHFKEDEDFKKTLETFRIISEATRELEEKDAQAQSDLLEDDESVD